MIQGARKLFGLLLLGGFVPAATAFAAGTSHGKNGSAEQFVAGKDSYRAAFDLGIARRFATRFLKDSRSLELRVSPARAAEFDVSRYYDSRFIHRVVVEEKNGDVILSFQLKNAPVAWLVTHQDNPWRLVVDIWKTEPTEPRNFDLEWTWQDDASGRAQNLNQANAPVSIPQPALAVKPVEIDLPAEDLSAGALGASRKGPESLVDGDVKTQGADPRFARLESVNKVSPEALSALERAAGAQVGGIQEFDALEKLASALYRAGQTTQALPLFKRLAALEPRRFQDSPRLLWMAGESAFVGTQAELANDYFQTLVSRFASHESGALGKLRLADLKLIKRGGDGSVQDLAERYTEIANNQNAPWAARIGASLRLLTTVVDERPEAARAHQSSLQSCLNGQFVSDGIKQNCAYVQTKFSVSQVDVVSADAALQRFVTAYPRDKRNEALQNELQNRVRFVLEEFARKKDFPAIAEFERAARPGLLDFTLRDSNLIMARVDGWLSVGDSKRALALLQVFAAATNEEGKRNEALALASQLYYKTKTPEKAEGVLRKLFASDVRKNTGLTDRAVMALKESARPPFSSKTAQYLLIDEMKFGRYVERDILMLVTLAAAARGREDADKVFDVLLTTTPRNADDARKVESVLMGYADDLRNEGRLAKAGDVYTSVANLAQTSKKAEASYKAGLVYARAGMVEKAKTAWQMSAADVTDKKFSSLASERLERIR